MFQQDGLIEHDRSQARVRLKWQILSQQKMLLRRGRLRHDAVGRIAIFLGGIHKQQREEGTLSADPAVYQFPGEVR